MVDLLEIYELDMELTYRLISPATIRDALREQGVSVDIAQNIIQLCQEQQFRNAAKLAVKSGCDLERVNQYLEKNALERKRFTVGNRK